MLVFIDDSGDPGFKTDAGSSTHLVIACCVFEDEQAAEATADAIRAFRTSIGWPESREFKFAKTARDIRVGLLREVAKHDFFVRTVVFEKARIRSELLTTDHAKFYNFAIATVLSHSNGTIRNARVKVDGSGGRIYKQAVANYLRRGANIAAPGTIERVGFADSRSNQLIQLADMVAGAVRRSRDTDHADRTAFIMALRPRLADPRSDVWDFR